MSSLEVRTEFDGCCWSCGQEIDLEQCLLKAMAERDMLQVEVQALRDLRVVRQAKRNGLAAAVRAYLSAIDNGDDEFDVKRARAAVRQALAAEGGA